MNCPTLRATRAAPSSQQEGARSREQPTKIDDAATADLWPSSQPLERAAIVGGQLGVAHEINTPIRYAAGSSASMAPDWPAMSVAEVAHSEVAQA
jgi:hypothetical protein